ncbi:MAG: hypothetical protein ACPHE2_06185, partial [Candidatus Puniceispirillaceae bacterium]
MACNANACAARLISGGLGHMPIVALGYMGIRSQALADWSDYAGRLLGMQKVDSGGGSMAFRMDDWRQRLVVIDEGG